MLTEFQVEMLIIVSKVLAIVAYLYCGERWCELNYYVAMQKTLYYPSPPSTKPTFVWRVVHLCLLSSGVRSVTHVCTSELQIGHLSLE